MPEFDSTRSDAYLIHLCVEYVEIIEAIGSGRFDVEDIHRLTSDRVVLHNQIMDEMDRLGIEFEDREASMQRAIQIARWLRPE